jgi:hypothetical protein
MQKPARMAVLEPAKHVYAFVPTVEQTVFEGASTCAEAVATKACDRPAADAAATGFYSG